MQNIMEQGIHFIETDTKIHIIQRNNVPSDIRILVPCYYYCCFRHKDISETELQKMCIRTQISMSRRPRTETKLPVELNS